MKLHLEIAERDLRRLVIAHVKDLLGTIEIKDGDITIEVKSRQNYKSEWEPAEFRARVEVER